MSKTKLAILIFGLAFGVNIAAFLLSKKTFTVDEAKNVWIYELPLTASPLDAYVALDLGPHQGVIGTLFQPNHLQGEHALAMMLADQWKWDQTSGVLEVTLKKSLHYSNGELIQGSDFVSAHQYVVSQGMNLKGSGIWEAFLLSQFEATDSGLRIRIPGGIKDFDLEMFLSQFLTHPLSGPIHPKNLEALKKGEEVKKDWISSGPYKIRKWNPKEIEMVSRDDFPIMLPKQFFRTLKFQSAPIKNPSCDFLLGRNEDRKTLSEHSVQETNMQLSVFWICRSFKQEAFCKDEKQRAVLAQILSGSLKPSPELLQGKKIRFRIPTGSDEFRASVREKIQNQLKAAGAEVEETSFFFKNSSETDLELEFVVTAKGQGGPDIAMSLGRMTSRLGQSAIKESNLMGEIANYPLQIYMKNMKGEIFPKVFIEPDLEEKKLPL